MGFWEDIVTGTFELMAQEERAQQARKQRRVEARRQQKLYDAQRMNDVQDALVYWATTAQDIDGYVAAHWRTILEHEAEMVRACHDSEGPFHNPARRLTHAAFALTLCQDKLERLLPAIDRAIVVDSYAMKPSSEAVFRLIYIFERYHADPVERLLPGARRMRDEAEGLVAGGPSDPNDPLAGLTRTDRAEFTRRLQAVTTLRALDLVLDEEHATYQSAVDRRDLTPAERLRLIEKNRANLNKLKQDYAAERGLLA